MKNPEGLPMEPLPEGEGSNEKEEEGQVIELPEDSKRVKALGAKLEEYRGRLGQERYKALDMQQHMTYRIAMLETLLETGTVNTLDLSRKLKDEHPDFNVEVFASSCRIIEDYVNTGGKETHGGTGLKS